ncbi:YybH family protein [Azohydromonas aeria]|uniref:YybH family protein n=1 Tax=Azohydromonas aeria TaxID=2590212 RepID=UPI0012FC3267|nr:nuclear transport factor 2 family protein [Azohydromonas aeria]
MKLSATFLAACCLATSAFAQATSADQLPQLYIEAYRNGDADRIAALFSADATFIPLLPLPRLTGRDAIRAYYQRALSSSRSRNITPSNQQVQAYGEVVVRSAEVRIDQELLDGREVSTRARVSFVYKREPQGWLIVHHHQSVEPAAPAAPGPAPARPQP